MAQTKQQIQSILAEANSSPRHRFGQNFMIDQNLVRVVADAGAIVPGDLVIEVGPGTGTLSEEILARAARLVAVEIDRNLARVLRERFAQEANFTLIEGDALAGKRELNKQLSCEITAARAARTPIKLVANLPYNIASPLIIECLIAGVELLAFTVQKEVSDRLRAKEGSDAYGPLTVMVQMLAKVEVLRTLPPQAFWPAPKIESSLVRLMREDRLGNAANDFSRFVQSIFSFRRKTLKKGLTQAGFDADGILKKTGIDPQVRPEVLSPELIMRLFSARAEAPRESSSRPPAAG